MYLFKGGVVGLLVKQLPSSDTKIQYMKTIPPGVTLALRGIMRRSLTIAKPIVN